MSNSVQHEATEIVHRGLAEVLAWLGEEPIEPWAPRHAEPAWVTEEISHETHTIKEKT